MNILESANYGIETKTFTTGLGKFEQTDCKCTITDDGYRIYRTPNKTYDSSDSSTRTMWGGLILRPMEEYPYALQKGHRYIIALDVRGKSSSGSMDMRIQFAVGSSLGGNTGLEPSPSNIVYYNPITANYSSSTWQTFYYMFDINEDPWKVATATSGTYKSGSTYGAYREFKYGFAYNNTGTMGTELYIKNVRMYDVTDMGNMSVSRKGIVDYLSFIESLNGTDNASIFKYGEVRANGFYEI